MVRRLLCANATPAPIARVSAVNTIVFLMRYSPPDW
jgi:hypothetical protein